MNTCSECFLPLGRPGENLPVHNPPLPSHPAGIPIKTRTRSMEILSEPITLTPEQQEARERILMRVSLRGERHTSLTGFAGSGKTTLAGTLADDLRRDFGADSVYACAPTHKAAHVLSQKLPVEAGTIHAFLGLKVVRDGKGGYKLSQNRNAPLPENGVVLLDESSMIGTQLWRFIRQADQLQWIFIGDPAQLPPVAEKPSPALETPGPCLERVVRQAEANPIIQTATRIRMNEPYLESCFRDGLGVAVTSSVSGFTESAFRAFKDQPADRPPMVRILAYRNVVVGHYNDRLRRLLHGGSARLPRFLPGDWLMMRETYFEDEIPVVKNSEEVSVLDSRVEERPEVGGYWKVHVLTVSRESGEVVKIPVLHESEDSRFHALLARFRNEAIDDKRPWRDYYDLAERFARVDYAHAMTVHKSQGSTFHTVYVDHRDLQTCKGPERLALIYVAATRPSHRLAILV